jgi:hypothetical protein
MVFAPTGRVLAETEGWRAEAIYADLSARLLEDYRKMDCYVLKAREPEAYRPLVDKTLQAQWQGCPHRQRFEAPNTINTAVGQVDPDLLQ